MTQAFDLVVIGGGPGGYVAAIRAAQLGLKTACVDKRGTFGGTCLNVGCIPSKALLQSSERFFDANNHFSEHGIIIDNLKLDLAAMQTRKTKVVEAMVRGIDFLFKKNKVTPLIGAARLTGTTSIAITAADGREETVTARNIVIATGSEEIPLPGVTVDDKKILSSTGALALNEVPEHLVVIGGGVIGLELGSVWQRLGSKVTIVDLMDRIISTADVEISRYMQRILTKQGMDFCLGSKVREIDTNGQLLRVFIESAMGGSNNTIDASHILVAVGRRPYTQELGLEIVGIECNQRGQIITDTHFRTSNCSIYAIGDVIKGPMLAHKAEEEGIAVAEIIAGQHGHVNYHAVPAVVYTNPEVAWVGSTEEDLKAAGTDYKIGKFPFSANGRSRANGDVEGFVKILADTKTDDLLGAHIIGKEAGTLIAELALAIEFRASAEDIARTCHAHPTVSETLKEAAMDVDKLAVHI